MELRFLNYSRLAQLISAFAVCLLGGWMWWRMFLMPPSYGKKFESDHAWLILMIVAPGIFVLVGSFLQAAYRKIWPIALVLIGSAAALWFIGLGAQFIFGYTGDRFALHVVYADLLVLLITLGASFANAMIESTLYFSKTSAEQIVGPERG